MEKRYIIEKEVSFCAGHRLLNYGGECKYLHGHNYVVTLSIQAGKLDDKGMVLDFKDIKQVAKAYIDEFIDHGMILNINDPLIPMLQKEKQKLFILPENPTAEAISRHLFSYFSEHFAGLLCVAVEETPTSSCSYGV